MPSELDGLTKAELIELILAERAARAPGVSRSATQSEQRLGLLVSTSAILSSSFDAATNLSAVVRALVPAVADLCCADIVERTGRVHRVALAAAEGLPGGAVEVLRRDPPALHPPDEPLRVADGGGISLAAAIAAGPERLHALASLGVRSLMLIPLTVRDRQLGMLTFVLTGAARYTESDLTFAADLASRVAIAVDNARLYAEAQLAISARQDLLSVVSHDLRSPITGIVLSADALLRHAPTDERRAGNRHLLRIRSSVRQMRRMVEDLLDLAALERGQLSVSAQPCDARGLLNEAAELFEPIAQDHEVSLIVDPAETVRVHCDGERVLQVLSNLIGNALRFTPPNGRITLSAHRDGASVRLRVEDTGPGIAPAQLATLFDRAARPRRQSRGSRGLGLYICRGIVEAHGGRIWAELARPSGAALSFTLPAAPDLPTARRRVLVAEDDKSMREIVAELLAHNGHAVEQAKNGQEALEYLMRATETPDVVLLDLNMPVMDGRELMREMKLHQALRSIPVVILSCVDSVDDEAARLGAAAAMKKPIDFGTLLSLVRSKGGTATA